MKKYEELKNCAGPSDVCIAVCVKNSASSIMACISSVISTNPGQIIVVDGNSEDGTLDILEQYDDVEVYSDKGGGLAYARKLAVENARKPFILFVGPDNILPKNFLIDILNLYKKSSFQAVSVQTRVYAPKTFWDYGQDFRWKNLMIAGEVNVLGTPSLYPIDILRKNNFSSEVFGPSDDTDLSDRLQIEGVKLGVLPVIVYETGLQKFSDTWQRYKWYGSGDFYFYCSRKHKWNFRRRLRSFFHPAIQFLRFSFISLCELRIAPILWLIIITFARYYGWIRSIK